MPAIRANMLGAHGIATPPRWASSITVVKCHGLCIGALNERNYKAWVPFHGTRTITAGDAPDRMVESRG
jgi:hypothetical protein